MVPDHLALLDVDDVGDVLVPFLPGDLVNADVRRRRDREEFFAGQLFQHAAIDAVDDFVVEIQEPARFGVGGDGGQAVDLLGKTAGEPTTQLIELLNADFAVNRAADLALGHIEKSPLAAQRQVFHAGPADTVDGLTVHVATGGTDRPDRVDQVDVEMKAVIMMIKHFGHLKIGQGKQFRDSVFLHRVSPSGTGSVGKQNLTRVVKPGALLYQAESSLL